MNKLLPMLLWLLAILPCYSQTGSGYAALPKDSTSQKVAYTGVVQVPGASKQELFSRAAEWLARQGEREDFLKATADPVSGLQLAHLEIKQPPLSFTDTHSNLYILTVAIYTKEGRFKYLINDITYQNINPALMTKDADHRVPLEYYASVKVTKHSTATLDDFDKRVRTMLASLTQAMSGQASGAKKDW